MDFRNHNDLTTALKNQDKAALSFLLKSETGAQLYTTCEKLCLKITTEAEALFKNSTTRAMANTKLLTDAVDVWLFKSCHAEWQNFSAARVMLQANASKISFDWNRVDVRQAEDALFILSPLEREIFVLRFLLKYPLPRIQNITSLTADQLKTTFHSAMTKVVA